MRIKTGGLTRRQLLVLIGASLYQCAQVGILYNCAGVFLAQMRVELGLSMTYISAFHSMRAVISAVGAALVSRLFFRCDKRHFLLLCVLSIMGCYLLMIPGATNWLWYVSAVLLGLPFCTVSFALPFVLTPWFPDSVGTATGIVMAFSGLTGVIFNPITSWLVESFGWQMAIVALSVITLLIALPSLELLFGEEPPRRELAEKSRSQGGNGEEKGPFPAKLFLLCALTMVATQFCMSFVQYLSMYAQDMGYGLSVGAVMTSVLMAGNIFGKLFFGYACDRFGAWKSMILAAGCVAAASVCFIVLPGCLPVLFLASFFYAMVYAMSMVLCARCSITAYGVEGSKRYIGLHTGINNAVSAAGAMCVGLIYDAAGSFTPVLVMGIATCALSCAASLLLERKRA